MPIYEYLCQDCQKQFEVIQRHDVSGENVVCPNCAATHVMPLMSSVQYRHADHWQKHHLSAMGRSRERDELKKEAEKRAKAMA